MIAQTVFKNTPRLELDESFGSIQVFNKPKVINSLDIHLHGEIEGLEKYENLFNCLRSIEENDEVRIWINSVGGQLHTALEIVQAIQDCEGSVLCIVTGECHSAASLIALGSPALHIGDFSTMLVHNASYGASGKASDISQFVAHHDKLFKKVMNKFYEGFLTEPEIQSALEGKEFWFDADEIRRRLTIREEYMKDKLGDLTKVLQEELEDINKVLQKEPKPKTRRKVQKS